MPELCSVDIVLIRVTHMFLKARGFVNCPVLLNGNVSSSKSALFLKEQTGAHGVMVGRSAIRNPWIFRQIREAQSGVNL